MCGFDSGRGGGRGRMRGFGRRGRGGRGGMSQTPTKDELDAQLDAYNAKVRCVFFFDSRKKVLVLALDSWLIG